MNRLRRHGLVGVLAAMFAPGALTVHPLWAQAIAPTETPDIGRRQVVPFLEGTKVFVNVPRASIRFEADIQPHLVVAQNFSDKLVIEESLTPQGESSRWRVAYSLVGTPRVRLRMFDERSAPVRTPSYMPRGTLMMMFFRGERTEPRHRVGIWSPELTVGHHSNGQDGCLFATDTLMGDECVGREDLSHINRLDGSFSTNYVRLGGRFRREWLRTINAGQPDEEHIGSTHWTVGAFADLHFNTARRLEPFYGTKRLHGYFGIGRQLAKVCKSRAAASATVSYVGEEPDGVPPFAYQVDGLCTFTPKGGWGVFARYYDGQDYYNLAFGLRIRRLQVGIQYEQDGFLRFITAQAKRSIEQRRQKVEQRSQ
jgi:hypothetical protein